MKRNCLLAILSFAATAHAGLVTNPGFEAGFTGWTTSNQLGSDGAFLIQTGTASPTNGFPVSAPPQGTNAAMSDAEGSGTHLLYQDFIVPLSVSNAVFTMSYFLNNGHTDYEFPATLDFSSPTLNQQARVDIMTTGADPFGIVVLQNLFQTDALTPLLTPSYVSLQADITALLNLHLGETLRLRVAEVDNVSFLNLGVDAIDITVSAVPEPSTWALSLIALAGVGLRRRITYR